MDGSKILLKAFIQAHPSDAAKILESLPFEETAELFGELSPHLSAEILRHLDPMTTSLCLEKLNLLQAVNIITSLPMNTASLFLRRVEEQQRKAILSELPPQASQQISLLLKNSEGTAGALMDTHVLTLPDDITINDSLKRARKYLTHQTHYIYILNRERVLVGFVTTSQLLKAHTADPVASIMAKPINRLSPAMNRQAILANPGWHELHTLPVVDSSGAFLGAVGYRTLHELGMMTEKVQPHRRGNSISSAFGELYWSGLSACINEIILAMSADLTDSTGQKRR